MRHCPEHFGPGHNFENLAIGSSEVSERGGTKPVTPVAGGGGGYIARSIYVGCEHCAASLRLIGLGLGLGVLNGKNHLHGRERP